MQYGKLALAHLSLELPLQVLMNKNRAYYTGILSFTLLPMCIF